MADKAAWADLTAPDMLFATVTISLGVVLFAFNAFVVAIALPMAVAEFGGGGFLAWATSLYIILSILSGAAAALLMQRLGARRLFVLAGLVFLGGTTLGVLAPDMKVLLAGRALQGLGAGAIEAGCYVLIPRLFPPQLIAKVFGIEAVAWAVAAFGGPALAGLLAQAFSWRVALAVSIPLALIFLALVPRVVPAGGGEGEVKRLPVLALLGITAGMTLVLVSDQFGGRGRVLGVLMGFALFGVVVRADRQASLRLLPRTAFGISNPVGLGLWVALLMPLSEAGQGVFVTYALQRLWQYTPLASGVASMVLALSWSAVQTWTAHRGFAKRRLIVAGAALLVAGQGMVVLAFASDSAALLFVSQAVVGAAFGAAWGAVSQVVMAAAPDADRDVTSGLLPVVLSAGYGIGAALLGLIANGAGFVGATGDALRQVMVVVFLTSAALAALALAAALRLRGSV